MPVQMIASELLPEILDCAPDALLLVDRSGRIVFANRQVTALFDYARDAVVGQNIEILLPERFRGEHLSHRQHYIEQARVRPMGSGLNLAARRRDGSEFPVEISLSPVGEGAQQLIAAAIRDVSDRRRVQLELQAARESADAANRAKSRFLATASHDLRQPLQTLSLLNGAMRRSNRDALLTDALQQQEQSIDAMARLLNALLDISKLESGAIKPEVTDFQVAAIFAEMRLEFAQLAAQKGLELRVETCDDCVQSDPSLVGQLLRNLVSNAIKYTREGWVLLRCQHRPEQVCLEVLDTGVGIPSADLPHIFEEFYQIGVAPNVSRDGYGLGLSIVRRIVDLLGLSLEVSSEPGKGSTFRVTLPTGAKAPVARGHARAALAPLPNPRPASQPILLIEDDPAVRSATQMLLKVSGYRSYCASSPEEALEQARAHPDLGLLVADFHLAEGKTGLQAIAAVRECLGRPIGAVLVTGDTSSAMQLVKQDQHLRVASKPLNADELLVLMQELSDAG